MATQTVQSTRPRVFFDVVIGGDGGGRSENVSSSTSTSTGKQLGRMEFELFNDIVPKTVENFRSLCTGERGSSRSSGVPLRYKGSLFHRITSNAAYGGDFTQFDGTGGESIYGAAFPNENFKLAHDSRGLLSMVSTASIFNSNGENNNTNTHNTSGSQFRILFNGAESEHLNGKNVVFGKLVKGENVLRVLENTATDVNGTPKVQISICNCGQVSHEGDDVEGKPSATNANLRPELSPEEVNDEELESDVDVDVDVDDEAEHNEESKKEEQQSERTRRSKQNLAKFVTSKLAKDAYHRNKDEKYVAKESEISSFPVPTPANPSAVFRDESARRAAQEKVDRRKAKKRQQEQDENDGDEAEDEDEDRNDEDDDDDDDEPGGEGRTKFKDSNKKSINSLQSSRLSKLAQLRSKMGKSRVENQNQVLEEHKRNNDPSYQRREKLREQREAEEERLHQLEKAGIPEEKAHLTAPAYAVKKSLDQRRAKKDRHAKYGWEKLNGDTEHRQYQNLLRRAGRGGEVDQGGSGNGQALEHGSAPSSSLSTSLVDTSSSTLAEHSLEFGRDDQVSERSLKRLANLSSSSVKKRHKKAVTADEDAKGINPANDRYNAMLNKTYDKYTTEIKGAFERGTAL